MDKSLLILDDNAPLRGRLRRAMEVRGFEVTDAGTVRDGINIVRKNPPAFGFTVDPFIGSLKRLACFASNQGKLSLERLGRRVEVRLSSPFPVGRSRINCTMPGSKDRWRWFGVQFTVP